MSIINFSIPGDPVAFARAGSKGAMRFTPKKQANYMTAVKHFASLAMAGRPPLDGPVSLTVDVKYIAPSSWSQKKRDATLWKVSRPDADNLAKICADAMNAIVFLDDAQVVLLVVRKQFGPICGTEITVSTI